MFQSKWWIAFAWLRQKGTMFYNAGELLIGTRRRTWNSVYGRRWRDERGGGVEKGLAGGYMIRGGEGGRGGGIRITAVLLSLFKLKWRILRNIFRTSTLYAHKYMYVLLYPHESTHSTMIHLFFVLSFPFIFIFILNYNFFF